MLPPPAPIAACRNLLILFTTAPSTSPAADVSVSTAKKLISAPSSRDKLSVSRRSKKVFGWSALWITISGTSIWRKKLCSLSTTLLAQKCYLCSRYVLSPMSPGRTPRTVEPRVGVEPTTCRLRIGCSTTELPRPAQTTIAFAQNYCQFGGRDGLLSTRKRIHRPADAYSNQKEEEQRPDNVFYTLDRLPPA